MKAKQLFAKLVLVAMLGSATLSLCGCPQRMYSHDPREGSGGTDFDTTWKDVAIDPPQSGPVPVQPGMTP